jgi:SAM-dependent methyltransferase
VNGAGSSSSAALQLYAQALHGEPGPLSIRFADHATFRLPVERYLAPADHSDLAALDGVRGPVLDVGCGPGRHLRALTVRGVFALGVDLSPEAVSLARRDGAQAIVGDVFGEVPRAGLWQTALLLDENLGIGGSPVRLLQRLRALLLPGGEVLAEVEPPGSGGGIARARIERGRTVSDWFPWARVSADTIEPIAAAAAMMMEARWELHGRWFVRLRTDG